MPREATAARAYKYDAFISYSRFDQGWVHQWLLPRLSAAGVTICIDVEAEEFALGKPIARAISEAIDHSRFTVAVLTPAFLESEWVRLEDDLARFRSITEREYSLIPLKLEPCDLPSYYSHLLYLDMTAEQDWKDNLRRLIFRLRGQAAAGPKAVPEKEKPASRYRNFGLSLQPGAQPDRFSVQAHPPFSTACECDVEWPAAEIQNLALQVKNGTGNRQVFKSLGGLLHAALFPDRIRKLWDDSERLMPPGTVMRLRLKTPAPSLAVIPWELICRDNYFITIARQHPLVRYSREYSGACFEPAGGPLNILIASASPADQETLRGAGAEASIIEEKLRRLLPSGAVGRICLLNHATPRKLQETLHDGYHVLHFVGHGMEVDGRANLIFEDARGNSACVDGESLFYLLRNTPLQLVVLNACQSATPSHIDPLLSAAHGALEAGVPATVAMLGRISDNGAVAFSEAFYQALAEGGSIEECVNEGRICIMTELGLDRPDWSYPVLFNNAPGELVFSSAGLTVSVPQPFETAKRSRLAEEVATRGAQLDTSRTVKHNLPPLPPGPFVGRDTERETARNELSPARGQSVVQIVGQAGLGRSTLALRIAHDFLDESSPFDGIAWIPSGMLAGQDLLFLTLARLFDIRGLMDANPNDRAIIVQRFLASGRYLLVFDDFEDAVAGTLVRNLPERSKAIVTGLEPAVLPGIMVKLGGLPPEAARSLFQTCCTERQIRIAPQEQEAILGPAGGSPFVLRWAAERLTEPGESPASVARTLAEAGGKPLRQHCLERSIESRTVAERNLLAASALLPAAAPASWHDGIAGVSPAELRGARESMERRPPSEEIRRAALEATAAETLRAMTIRALDAVDRFVCANTGSPVAAERWAGFDRLEEQLGNLIWAIDRAAALEQWDRLLKFREALDEFMYRRGLWQQGIRLGETALEAATARGDPSAMAWCCLYPLTRLHYHTGNFAAAQRWSQQALALFLLLNNDYGIIAAQRYLGRALQSRASYDRARIIFEAALERARKNPNNRDQQAMMLATLAGLAQAQGRNGEAKQHYEAALEIYEKLGKPESIAPTLHELGNLALVAGALDEAEARFQSALDALRGSGWKNREASLRYSLALVQEERGRLGDAKGLLEAAQATFHELAAYTDLACVDATLTRVSAALAHEQRNR